MADGKRAEQNESGSGLSASASAAPTASAVNSASAGSAAGAASAASVGSAGAASEAKTAAAGSGSAAASRPLTLSDLHSIQLRRSVAQRDWDDRGFAQRTVQRFARVPLNQHGAGRKGGASKFAIGVIKGTAPFVPSFVSLLASITAPVCPRCCAGVDSRKGLLVMLHGNQRWFPMYDISDDLCTQVGGPSNS